VKRLLPFGCALVGLGLFWSAPARGQAPTWTDDIAAIVYENCTTCHRPGEIGPFPLTTYEEAAAWSAMMAYVAEERIMPPWKPDPTYTTFVGEKHLTQEQIDLLAAWAAAGAPIGNPDQIPAPPEFPSGSQLGTPDLVLTMSEAYPLQTDFTDEYRVFVLPTSLTEVRDVAAVEFRPGNASVVHHVVIGYETSGDGATLDALTPGYGYPSFGDFGVAVEGTLSGYTPGINAIPYPAGIGKTLPAGANLLVQIHYAPVVTEEWDQSSINIFFKEADDPAIRQVEPMSFSPSDMPYGYPSFKILPDEVSNFLVTKELESDISLINIQPHSHYLGKSYHVWAKTPEDVTIPIIRINHWDFNWQGAYTFPHLLPIPAGSTLYCMATYDNTAENPNNPSSPPVLSSWGEASTDEMLLVRMQYVSYENGDETISISTSLNETIEAPAIEPDQATFFALSPNPTRAGTHAELYLNRAANLRILLFDLTGRMIRELMPPTPWGAGFQRIPLTVESTASGLYLVAVEGDGFRLSQRLVLLP
jgi:hypothetical protein